MKIFLAPRFDLFVLEVKVVNDIGDWIVLQGKNCSDLMPFHGVELDEGEQQKLTKWLSEHDCK